MRLAALVFSLLLVGCTPPSDQKMIAHFEANRAQFIQLRDMALGDQTLGFDRVDYTDLEADWENDPPKFPQSDLSSMPSARRDSYRKMFDALGVEIVIM